MELKYLSLQFHNSTIHTIPQFKQSHNCYICHHFQTIEMRIVEFLKSRTFIFNLVLAVLLVTGIIWGVLKFLDWYTLHGQTVTVPNLTGLKTEEVEKLVTERKLKYEVVDSVYNADLPRGSVIEQDPEAESLVKENRTIYLTVNAMFPPSVPMPRLVDRSLRSALIILENMGLKAGAYTYEPDLCKNCVLKQQLNGKEIEEGEMVMKGATIDLILGMGISDEETRVPLLIDLPMNEAVDILKNNYLNLGGENYDETVLTHEDSLKARVYMQDPAYSPTSFLPLGSSVNLWFTLDKSRIDTNLRINNVKDTINHNSAGDDAF